jgi:hypothetical protein
LSFVLEGSSLLPKLEREALYALQHLLLSKQKGSAGSFVCIAASSVVEAKGFCGHFELVHSSLSGQNHLPLLLQAKRDFDGGSSDNAQIKNHRPKFGQESLFSLHVETW